LILPVILLVILHGHEAAR